jgi:CHAT domain
LEIEEEKAPELAALPWEFMCMPPNMGEIWLSIAPNVVFSRYRWQSSSAKNIQIKNHEKLRIGLVVSAPNDLGKVVYEELQKDLARLKDEQAEKFDLLPLDYRANRESINNLLTKNPHILHFVGHGRFHEENNQQFGTAKARVCHPSPFHASTKWSLV